VRGGKSACGDWHLPGDAFAGCGRDGRSALIDGPWLRDTQARVSMVRDMD